MLTFSLAAADGQDLTVLCGDSVMPSAESMDQRQQQRIDGELDVKHKYSLHVGQSLSASRLVLTAL
jgi:hypothetical protein